MSFKSASLKDKTSINGESQKGQSIADGYTFPFLFSGAEQSILSQMKLTVYIFSGLPLIESRMEISPQHSHEIVLASLPSHVYSC